MDATETEDVQEKVIEETNDKKEDTDKSTKEDSEQPGVLKTLLEDCGDQ